MTDPSVEDRLRESEQQLRALAARLQAARDEERTTLARELHDDLGQTLTAMKLELARAISIVRRERIPLSMVDRLQSLVSLTEIGITTIKRITSHLRPTTLDHLSLVAAIEWEATAFRARTGLRCHVAAAADTEHGTSLSRDQETVVFRIVQECLTNVARHAQAGAVHVRIIERPGHFELQVRDNGRGISEADVKNLGAIGLLGMRERATLIGGTLAILGRHGKGTTVTVRVPRAKAIKARTPRRTTRPRSQLS